MRNKISVFIGFGKLLNKKSLSKKDKDFKFQKEIN